MHHITNCCIGHQDKSISGIVKVSLLRQWKHHQISHILVNSAFQCGSFLWLLPRKGTNPLVPLSEQAWGYLSLLRRSGVGMWLLVSLGLCHLLGALGCSDWSGHQWSLAQTSSNTCSKTHKTGKIDNHFSYSHPSPLSPPQCIAVFFYSPLSSLNNRSSIFYYINIDTL